MHYEINPTKTIVTKILHKTNDCECLEFGYLLSWTVNVTWVTLNLNFKLWGIFNLNYKEYFDLPEKSGESFEEIFCPKYNLGKTYSSKSFKWSYKLAEMDFQNFFC